MINRTFASLFALVAAGALGACSGAPGASKEIGGNGEDPAEGHDAGTSKSTVVTGADASVGMFTDPGDAGTTTPDANTTCATTKATATNVPVYLVFMIDKSDSMNMPTRWPACKVALESFLAAPSSNGLEASLSFFPQRAATECSDSYAMPTATMRPLPDGAGFQPYLDGVRFVNGTPTHQAIKGAIEYAQSIQAIHRGARTAIVLVTDGEPCGCGAPSGGQCAKGKALDVKAAALANIAATLAEVRDTIPTYVIGVGPETINLNTLAEGGGTAPALVLKLENPAQVTADFEAALARVKTQTLSCEYEMAKPPGGATLDVDAVNVVFTPKAGGPPQTLSYNKTCADGKGWRYDDPSKPTKIEMCGTSCEALQTTQGGQVEIVFGCKTQGDVPTSPN